MTFAPSLFDAPAGPVLPSAAQWVTGTLFGDLAVALCVIAVAIMGMLLMIGRLTVRDAARVILACFVLLGAPLIATGLRMTATEAANPDSFQQPATTAYPPSAPPPS